MPGTNFENDADGYDPQDQSEAFDETNFTDGEDTSHARSFAGAADGGVFEDLPEVEDLTQIDGDRDDDEALAFDAAEFDADALDDADFEEDHELAYLAATEERQSDLDGLGPEDDFLEAGLAAAEIEGLDEVRDAGEAEGGEDDFTDYQARRVGDEDLKRMGYAEDRDGETRARRNKD